MSAAARAEARRKAILARGSDRLAKLTTSARGEDAPAYMQEDVSASKKQRNLESFVGEETDVPPSFGGFTGAGAARLRAGNEASHVDDPSGWSQEQQEAFMRALGLQLPAGSDPDPSGPGSHAFIESGPGAADAGLDPMQAILSQLGQAGGIGKGPAVARKPPTQLQKFMPFIHLLATWSLLVYFVIYRDPKFISEWTGNGLADQLSWHRWSDLSWTYPSNWGEQFTQFFWAFISLQMALHALRIWAGFDAVEPPMLLSFALPHLPAPLPSVIIQSLKYATLGATFLDNIAGLVFAIGFIIFFAGWIANQ